MQTKSMLIFALLAVSCSSGSGDDSGPGPGDGSSGGSSGGSSSGALKIFPDMLYSGVDSAGGSTTYKVMISASGATGVQWSVSDSKTATITGTDAVATVTALKSGSATVKATAGTMTISVPLTVTAYAAADLAAGMTAYTTKFTCARSGCHDAAGPDVGPADICKHTDAQILAALASGTNPEGGPISIGAAAHTFAVAAGAESRGIVAYMRSLPARPPVDDK